MSTILQALQNAAPYAKVNLSTVADTLQKYGSDYGVTGDKRLSAFIAQAAHETDGFKTLEEYASGKAYEGRADLGNTQPGDGVKFKGRGIFQTTGRSNYLATSKHLYGDDRLLQTPELLKEEKAATLAALYYWKSRNLSPLADAGDFEAITKKINGGLNGWADRLSYYEKLKLFFENSPLNSTGGKVGVAIGAAVLIYFAYKYRLFN